MIIKLQVKIEFLIKVVMLLFVTNSYSQYILKSDSLPSKVSLHSYTAVTDYGEEEASLKQVIASFDKRLPQVLQVQNYDLGFTQNHFWGRFKIANTTTTDLQYFLELARPITNIVELYLIDDATNAIVKQQSGDAIPFTQRSFISRKSIFNINLKSKHSYTIYFHLKSDGEVLVSPVMLYSAEGYINMISFEQLLYGAFYGLLAVTAIIYFFFFLALSENIFLYYTLYVLFVGLLQFSLDGFWFRYITPSGGWFLDHAVLIFAILGTFLSGKYSEMFLKLKSNSPVFYKLFILSYVVLLAILLMVFFVPSLLPFCYVAINVVALLCLLLVAAAVINLYLKGAKVNLFFTIGICCLVAGFTLFILNNVGVIPSSFLAANGTKLGTTLEVVFLSLATSSLIKNLKDEKNSLNQLALVRAEEMNSLKSYFLSNISHELRTPLNAIMNLIDSISNDINDEGIKKNCEVIKYSSSSLLNSVNDILDFSKIEKKELHIDTVKFNPALVFEKLAKIIALRAKDKHLNFVFEKPEELPSQFLGDEMRLNQIINNILNNAIKFTNEGSVTFKVTVIMLSKERAKLIVKIADTGIGISDLKRESIFDSFTQNNSDNKRNFNGLGLGLYIVKKLVDMQNGSIEIDSKLGKGTTCTVVLDYDVVPQEEGVKSIDQPVVYDLYGKTILVVEDNSINQMVIKMIAKKWLNTSVIYANNGQEGLEAVMNNKIDIILMDLQMPVMDGYEATQAIRDGLAGAENANIPIIAVTADVMETTKAHIATIGMNNYLSKPIQKETLFQMISDLVN
ncbi:hybrid sensor histidine kinase/response regulator [Flavobacterium frigidarium]|uniref:histidine kinase n=1 Tax=Flavobacterium frigidarium TaxID=99286 RepID=A0ABV4KBB4_9FLAO